MAKFTGVKCPICEEKFAENDDIVVCPDCGAPYHRACYHKEGHCIKEELHAAHSVWSEDAARAAEEQRYDAYEPLRCSKCGTINPPEGIFCQICGSRMSDRAGPHGDTPDNTAAPTPISLNAFTTPYGGISPDEEIDGVPVRDLALFVGENSFYFIPRFKEQASRRRISSWNWPAFFFRGFYYLYRKMYAVGATLLAFGALISIPSLLLQTALLTQSPTVFGMGFNTLNRLSMICNVLSIGLCVCSSSLANRLYCSHALRTVRQLKGSFPDPYAGEYIAALTRRGRTNRLLITVLLLLMFAGSLCLSFILVMGLF